MKPQRSVFIEGRLWRDKVYGNTYYSTRIWVDGVSVLVIPKSYGYGDQYVYDSLYELAKAGYDIPHSQSRLVWEKLGVDFYYSAAWVSKKELWNENTYVSDNQKQGETKNG